MLLEYCLSDIDTTSPGSLRQLAGLQLIPTMSSTLTALQLSGAPGARPLFLPTRQQQAVLVDARDVLVACEVRKVRLCAILLLSAAPISTSRWLLPSCPSHASNGEQACMCEHCSNRFLRSPVRGPHSSVLPQYLSLMLALARDCSEDHSCGSEGHGLP